MEDWADNTTAISGYSDPKLAETFNMKSLQYKSTLGFRVQKMASYYFNMGLSIASFFSPILMVILPQCELFSLR